MKKRFGIFFCLLPALLVILPVAGSAQEKNDPAGQASSEIDPSSDMARADELLKSGEMEKIKEALEICEREIAEDPDDFEAIWLASAACREYATAAQHKEAENWKDICGEYGKKGMEYAKKAMELKPDKPHGYYFYGLNVGAYSEGVGLITALKEGLKNKTQENLERAYEIDKTFNEGGPILALGRFWQQVPWPYNDKDKAMEYYRELMNSPYFGKKVESYIYPAEILMNRWGEEPKEEARKLLEKALAKTDEPYWENRARELLEEL
jgi:hypothetical protein